MNQDCPYCNINLPLEHHDEQLFLWHLNGHGEEIKTTLTEKLHNTITSMEQKELFDDAFANLILDIIKTHSGRSIEGLKDWFRLKITEAREQGIAEERERVREWVENPRNISIGQAGDFGSGGIVILKRHLLIFLSANSKQKNSP